MRRAIFPLLGALVLAGCVATQRDILDLSQQTDGMNLQVHQLKKIMSNLQSNQADLNSKLEQMSSDITVLNENLKDNREAMSNLSAKMDDVGAGLGHKFTNLDTSIKQSRELFQEREKKEEQERLRKEEEQRELERRKQEEEKAQTATTPQAAGPAPSEIYHKARVQYSQKKYAMAAEGFKLYVNEYPKGEMVDIATYYLGKVRYAQKQWKLAARNFALVLDRYPKSDITPSARLHYALCLMKMKTLLEEAKRYLESIPDDFPKSPEAKKASELLRSWEKNIKSAQDGDALPEPEPAEKAAP
ncbi:MAG: tetratricopeptide repeat protein [Elusimicrobiota bacterium]